MIALGHFNDKELAELFVRDACFIVYFLTCLYHKDFYFLCKHEMELITRDLLMIGTGFRLQLLRRSKRI